jgi:hypothetical protein
MTGPPSILRRPETTGEYLDLVRDRARELFGLHDRGPEDGGAGWGISVGFPPRHERSPGNLGKIPGTRAPGQRCGPSLEARLPDNAAVRPRVEEGSGHGGAGDGKSAGDLAGDQVGVGGQALVSLVIRHALIGARKGVECGEEFGNRCGPRL